MSFEAVLFDFAGVLTQPMLEAFAPAVIRSGVDMGDMARSMGELFLGEGDTDSPTHRLERGELTLEAFIDSFDGTDKKIVQQFLLPESDTYLMTGFEPHAEMLELVKDIRSAGMGTAVVSNNVCEWQPAWETALPTPQLFDELVFSWQVGCRKPNPDIYNLALDRLGVAAERAVFLDDSANMVEGAKAAGLTGVLVDVHGRAIAETRALLGL